MFIQDDVNREMEAVKKSKPKTYGEIRSEVERESARCDEPDDILDRKWTQKKSYSTQQMMKIMDAVRIDSVFVVTMNLKVMTIDDYSMKVLMVRILEILIDRNALILHVTLLLFQ